MISTYARESTNMGSQDQQRRHRRAIPVKGKAALLLTFVFFSTSSLALAAAKSPDADAIADLAKSLSNLPPSWTAGGDVCGYEGVTCDKGSGRVTAIHLLGKGLAGTLPRSSLSSLAALTELHLGGNALAGAVPSLAGLASLGRVVLDDNAFTSLPDDFLQDVPSLRDLHLDSLPLQPWSLPEAIASLENFSASAASLTGPFPANFRSSSLRMLRLPRNNLSGPIDAVASLKSLTLLMIDQNSFSGPIPDLSGISRLETFSAGSNLLTGLVPASMTTAMPSLRTVKLVDNLLQGPMPRFGHGVYTDVLQPGNNFCHQEPGRPCDAQVTALLQVAAGFGYPLQLARNWYANTTCNNDGTTSWKGVICNGTDVTEVSLERMNLSGTISPAFANLTALVRLNLSGNHLTGVIPDALAAMPRLAALDVTGNNLTGQIPNFKPSVVVIAQGNRFGESAPAHTPAAGLATPAAGGGTPAAGGGVASLPANSASRLNVGIIANVILVLFLASG